MSGRLSCVLLAGVFSGFLVLTRPVGILVPILFLVFMLLQVRATKFCMFIKRAGIFLLAFFMLLAPWIIRNYIVYRTFFPLSSEAGITLYRGNNPIAPGGTGGWHSIGIDTVSGFSGDKGMNDVEEAGIFRAWRAVHRDVKRFLYLYWRRFLNM